MFREAATFNQDLSEWDVRNVTNMRTMFREAATFNQDLSEWDVRNVTNMRTMFREAATFNQDLSEWDVRNVTNMRTMFREAATFNQDLSGWNVRKVTDMYGMFEGVTLSIANYDALLRGWSELALQREVPFTFSGGDSKYCDDSARNILLTYNWDIRDGGHDTDENCAEEQADTGLATNIDDNVVIDSYTLTAIGLTLTPSTLTLNEGATTTYTAMLYTQPTGAVTVTITSDNTDVTPTPATLTFTTTNWNSAQSVTITAEIDTNLDDNNATLTHTASNSGYAGVSAYLSVTATDTDTPPTFAGGAAIASQTYPVGTPITTLTLPEASGGISTLAYALTPKTSIPGGLTFDASARTLSGTPTTSSPATTLAYTVTDSATPTSNTVALTFTVTVVQVIVDNGGEVSYSSGAIATTDVGDDNNDMRLMLPTDHTVTTVMVGVGTNTPDPR